MALQGNYFPSEPVPAAPATVCEATACSRGRLPLPGFNVYAEGPAKRGVLRTTGWGKRGESTVTARKHGSPAVPVPQVCFKGVL